MKDDFTIDTLLGLAASLTVADAAKIMTIINGLQAQIDEAHTLTERQVEVMRKDIVCGDSLPLSYRTFLRLSNAKLVKNWQIIEKTDSEMLQIEGIDLSVLIELKKLFSVYDLRLGMKFDRTIFTDPRRHSH